MYRESCTVYYPDQQMHNIYINNILYVASTYIYDIKILFIYIYKFCICCSGE